MDVKVEETCPLNFGLRVGSVYVFEPFHSQPWTVERKDFDIDDLNSNIDEKTNDCERDILTIYKDFRDIEENTGGVFSPKHSHHGEKEEKLSSSDIEYTSRSKFIISRQSVLIVLRQEVLIRGYRTIMIN